MMQVARVECARADALALQNERYSLECQRLPDIAIRCEMCSLAQYIGVGASRLKNYRFQGIAGFKVSDVK